MKTRPVLFLAALLPAQALAGAEYTAEDVIRYFEQLNAAPAHEPSSSGVVVGGASAAAKGIVLGGTSRGGIIGGPPQSEDAPLAIPLTGAKAGHVVVPVSAAASASVASPAGGYDLLVTFELNSATLTPQARDNLEAFARALASPTLAGLRFAVEGHTDATGSADHNLRLSEDRAASVVGYLVEHGVEPARLTAAGYGETRPRLADPEHPDNRRVETRPLD